METQSKSSATSPKNQSKKEPVKKYLLGEILDLLGVQGTKRFAANKKFKNSDPKSQKEWESILTEKRILQK